MEYLTDVPLTSESIQYAVDAAHTAVVVLAGDSYCGLHVHGFLLKYVVSNLIKS